MQGLRKAVTNFPRLTCPRLQTLDPSSPITVTQCTTYRFTSTINPVQDVSLLGKLGKNDILHRHSLSRLKLFSNGYRQQLKTISTFHSLFTNKSNEDSKSASSAENSPLIVSKDLSGSLHPTPQCFPLSCHSPNLSDNPYIVFCSRGQFRSYSDHARRRRGQGKNISRTLSTQKNEQKTPTDSENQKELEKAEGEDDSQQNLTLYQRFKKTYKEHGKVLIGVHLVTSAVWFGTFYTAASCGLDIVPYLESWNFSEKFISYFRSGGLGGVALAYFMYKVATPARYTVTIGGTNLVIRYLRKKGRMQPVPEGDRLRELYKEGKQDLKIRSQQRMNNIKRIRGRFPRRRIRGTHKGPGDHKE